MDKISVECCIYSLGGRGLFVLKLSGSDKVTTLRKAIKDELPIRLRDVDPLDLDLYAIPSPDDAHIKDVLKHLELEGRPQLLPWHTLSSLNLSDKLIVVNPSTRGACFFLRSIAVLTPSDNTEARDILQRMKRTDIARYAPSMMGVTQYTELQASLEDRLLDRRRIIYQDQFHLLDDDVPPIALVYQPFGEFLDRYLCRSGGSFAEAPSPHLTDQVDTFVAAMNAIYADEDSRRSACLPPLNSILHATLGGVCPLMTTAIIDGFMIDGHSLGPHGEPILMANFKNEISGLSSAPILELCNCYHRLVGESLKDHPELLLTSKMPVLALTVVGMLTVVFEILDY